MSSLEPLTNVNAFGGLSGDNPSLDGMKLDAHQALAAVMRNRILVVVVLIIAIGCGFLVTAMTPRQYQALATVQIEQQAAKVLENDETASTSSSQDSDRFLQTQIGLLNSKALAATVVDDLQLSRDESTLVRLGMKPKQVDSLPDKKARAAALVSILRSELAVTLPRDSRIAQLAVTCPDPELCARIANGYARNFIVYNLRRKYSESSYALKFLNDQLKSTKERLQDSERALVAYAAQAGLVGSNSYGGANGGDSASTTMASLTELNTALSAAEAARIEAQEAWLGALDTPLMSQPEVLQSTAIQALVERKAEAQAAYEQERQRRKPSFPSMQQATAQIAALNAQINAIAIATRASLENRYKVAKQNENALRAGLAKAKKATLDEQGRSIEYNILRREVDTNRTMYDGLLQRFKEVSAASGVTSNNISIVDQAEVPSIPVSPKLRMNIISFAIGGLLLSFLLVIIRERTNDQVHFPDDVPEKLGLPLLGVMPRVRSGMTPVVALADPRSPLSEGAAAIRASLDMKLPSDRSTTIVIASSKPSEGKSTSALALASDFARAGRRVVLVDADMRKPSLHRLLDRRNDAGTSTILEGSTRTWTDAVQQTDLEGLDFIAAGPIPSNPAQLLSGTKMSDAIARIQRNYDLVVIDSPPVLQLADAVTIASRADVTILIVEANATKIKDIRGAIRRLRDSRIRQSGVIVTKFRVKSAEYTYTG